MSYAFALLLLLVPLVLVHELGHFVVAKICRVSVSQFAFGFGRKLFGFRYKDTEYRWNLWPLGGYVDFMGEALYSDNAPNDPRHFLNQSKGVRLLILLAGPFFNYVLAFLLLWFAFAQPMQLTKFHGDPVTVGVVQPGSAEGEAGLLPGDRILSFNQIDVSSVDQLLNGLHLRPKKEINLKVERADEILQITYVNDEDRREGIGKIGFEPAILPIVADVTDGSPAERAGLLPGDRLTAINGQQVFFSYSGENMVSRVLNEQTKLPIALSGLRNGEPFETQIRPERNSEGKLMIGIRIGPDNFAKDRSWLEAVGKSFEQCKSFSTLIFRTLSKLVSGDLSVKSMSSVPGIAKYAKETLETGLWNFILFMAILSVNLAIINMLPIPILDGGEIFVLVVEWISRKNFSLQTKMKIKMVGLVFLVAIMATVLISDVLKLVMYD